MSELRGEKSLAAFLALVRAGLWGDVKINGYGLKVNDLPAAIDYNEVLRLAEGQTVVGLITAGVEKSQTGILQFTEKLTLLGMCQLIERKFTVKALL